MKAEVDALDRKLEVAIERSRYPIVPYTSPSTILQQVAFWHGVTVLVILERQPPDPDRGGALRCDCRGGGPNPRVAGKRPGLMDLARLFKRDHTSIISALPAAGASRLVLPLILAHPGLPLQHRALERIVGPSCSQPLPLACPAALKNATISGSSRSVSSAFLDGGRRRLSVQLLRPFRISSQNNCTTFY